MKKALWLSLAMAAAFAASGASIASAQVKLGVAGPITGGSAAFGAQLKNGVEQAVADINKAGGILGQQITISVGDDRADPKEGVSVANKFVGDGIKFDLLAEDAAGLVDVLDGLLHSMLELRTEGGAAAGDGASDPQFDLR